MKPAHKFATATTQHLHNAQIVAYLDGELAAAELESVRTHLEKCWTCRSWVGVVQGSIDRFLASRKSGLPADTAFDETRVDQFRQRLMRHAAEVEAESASLSERFSGLISGWRGRFSNAGSAILQHPKAALAAVMAICLVAVMFTDALSTRVSADTVLNQAETYETVHAPGAAEVMRSTVVVERIDRKSGAPRHLGTLTILHDSASRAVYVSMHSDNVPQGSGSTSLAATANLNTILSADPQESRLAQYLAQQHWVPDVSVAGFRSLVEARASKEESVSKEGNALEVHYPFAGGHPSGITEAMLAVDAHDFAPKSVSIFESQGSGQREYRFTRTATSAEPRTAEMARAAISADFSSASGRNSPSQPLVQRPTPLSYLATRATEEEVSVAQALHQADACLGEEVYIFPMSDGSLLVQGLVDTATRRDAIRQALRSVSGPLRIEVFVPRELKSGSELYAPPDQFGDKPSVSSIPSTTATLADLSSAKMPLYDRLFQQFSQSGASADDTNKQVAVFSNEVVTLARQTFLHAWALKKLDRQFSEQRTAELPTEARDRIEQIRQDHRRWISTLAQRQAEMLSKIAGPEVVAGVSEVSGGQQDSSTLLHLAQQQNDLVRSLFTTSQQAPEASVSLSQLLGVLHRLGV